MPSEDTKNTGVTESEVKTETVNDDPEEANPKDEVNVRLDRGHDTNHIDSISLADLSRAVAINYGAASSRYMGAFNGSGDNQTYLNTFNRYYKIYPNDEMGSLISYVFIVRPDCNIDDAIAKDAYFRSLSQKFQSPLIALTAEHRDLGVSHHFIPFLVDRTLNFQVPDVNLKTYDFEQPFSTYRTTYAGNTNESRSGQTFEIQFRENADLDVSNFFNAWISYISGVTTNKYIPKRKYIESRVREGTSVIDYATSIYFIKTKADGSEIVFYHKQVGVFPTNAPHSNWSYSAGGSTDNNVNISFAGGYPESFNPYLLAEFNYNAGVANIDPTTFRYSVPSDSEAIKYRNYENPIAGVPFITCNYTTGKYYLRWKDPYK